MRTSRVRSLLSASALLGASAIAALAAAEVALRVTHLAPARGVHTVDEAEFTRIPGLFSPGQQLVDWRNRNLPHRVTIDSLGYRGAELPRAKPAGELRILFVGDSFTYGDFVHDEETVPAILESELARRCTGIRVINAGVGGTTIVTQAALVARAGVIEPDLVLLMFFENDVADLRDPLWTQLESNRKVKSEFPTSMLYGAFRNLALWNLGQRLRAVMHARRQQQTPEASDELGSRPADELRDVYARRLRVLRDSLGAEGTALATTAFPSHHSIFPEPAPERIDWFANLTRGLDLPYVDVFSELVAAGLSPDDVYLLPHDGHASPAGNQIAARVLARELARLSPLAEHCQGDAG